MVLAATTAAVEAAGKKLLSNVIDDLYTFVKEKAQLNINKRNVARKLPTLISRMQNVRLVKTLWQVDAAVDLESFYCDSHIIFPIKKDKIRRKIDKVPDFGLIKNIVIRGIAGQGKSIFLRHLCIKEFEAGQRIPIFIELRRIQQNETLFDHIFRFLDILDLPIEDKLFKILLQSGKFIFFFDAFDEIPETKKQSVLNELEQLATSSENTQLLVTTRPNTAIEMVPIFNVLILDDLKEKEYQTVIIKLTDSKEYANNLIKTIGAHKAHIAELLCNPLLVTLLLISYKSFQKLPEKLSDFYDSIFFILLSRHDGTKPGFIRPRRCAINDNLYREIFDAFCFESKKLTKSYLNYQEIFKLIEISIKRANGNVDADGYLKDIKDVTCLILQEGEEYRFIHKSVQEYYAASFIKNRPEDSTRGFYNKCLIDFSTALKWQQELGFLAEIDQYRYNKYYLIPLCHKWLNVDNNSKLLKAHPKITTELTKYVIGGFILSLKWDEDHLGGLNLDTLSQILDEMNYLDDFFNLNYYHLCKQIIDGKISIDKKLMRRNYYISKLKRFSKPDPGEFDIVVEQVIKEGYLIDEFNSISEKIVNHIYRIWKQAYSYVSREDSFNITEEIDL